MAGDNTTAAVHTAGKGLLATNDPAESSFGAISQELSTFDRIAFGSAAGARLCAILFYFSTARLPYLCVAQASPRLGETATSRAARCRRRDARRRTRARLASAASTQSRMRCARP
eukprot:5775179-Pleurochrysis_carterae.AAC.1